MTLAFSLFAIGGMAVGVCFGLFLGGIFGSAAKSQAYCDGLRDAGMDLDRDKVLRIARTAAQNTLSRDAARRKVGQ